VAVTAPEASSNSIGNPVLRLIERSSGTLTCASSSCGWSIVVTSVAGVTRSPTRIGMSPTMPAVGAVTR
jgi:hypothetical protein